MIFREEKMTQHTKQFINRLRYEKQAAENTIQAYQGDLRDFEKFLNDKQPVNATEQDIIDYIFALHEQQRHPHTISRKISCLKSFYKDLIRLDLLHDNPTKNIDSPKKQNTLPKTITETEMEIMCNSLNNSSYFTNIRNACIIEMLYSCGMRVSELCNLTTAQLHLEEDFIRVLGKGNKERLVPIGRRLKEILSEYLSERERFLDGKNSTFVFVSRRKKAISRGYIWNFIKKLSINLNITAVHPHMIRHAFASHMLANGADLRIIQELLGHENLSTTELYTHVEKKALHQSIMNHPLAKVSFE